MIELAMIAVIAIVLAMILLPAMKQRWNADGQSVSINNNRWILAACAEYRLDHADRVPMRGSGYSNGQITGGWDTWSFAGKNCNVWWLSGPFDESAYSRFLNPYLQANVIPVPPGYANTGSGATWTFQDGIPTAQQRATYQVKACRSPGDVTTRQRSWPNPTPGVSCYDDVGSSYHVNMMWWDQPGWPSSFTGRYNAGTLAISGIQGKFGVRRPSDFAWITDQVGTVVPNLFSGTVEGEFGGANMSVIGYLDGRAAYTPLVTGASFGPGYTFLLQ
jgi:type II secretory pathway pseudopilin PulG